MILYVVQKSDLEVADAKADDNEHFLEEIILVKQAKFVIVG